MRQHLHIFYCQTLGLNQHKRNNDRYFISLHYIVYPYNIQQYTFTYRIIIISMSIGKISLILALVLFTCQAGWWANQTGFWGDQLAPRQIRFQAYSGYEQIDWYHPRGTSGMFYQFFSAFEADPTKPNANVPVFIWLQGGPGASSQFGAFTEIGPVLYKNGKATYNGNSWNHFGHYIFIDSPLNVGFSYYGDRESDTQVSSAEQAGDHLQNFLYNFYKTWPALTSSPLYITGESFAGHYIPVLARKLLRNETKLDFKVAGVAIGDGWTDPLNQGNFYDTYLWSVGVIERSFREVCTWFQTNSIVNIYQGNYVNATAYFDFLTNNDTTPEVYFGGISMFNFRNYDGLDESFAKVLDDNRQRLTGRTDIKFMPGNDKIYTAFAGDVTKSVARDVAEVAGRVKTLIYNGQNDVVVNTPGVLQYLNSLVWNQINQWKKAERKTWTIGGQTVGWAKTHGNLWFVLVNGAGHMVPTDQPQAAFNMMGHFLKDEYEWDQ